VRRTAGRGQRTEGGGVEGEVSAHGSALPRSHPPRGHPPSVRAPLAIRQASREDLPTIVALRLSLLREHARHPIYGRLRADAAHRARELFGAQLDSSSEVMFLAERAGQVVGILRCVESTGSPLLDPPRYGYVSSVFVTPSARRAGVLRALVERAVRWCEDRGLDEMRLHSVAGDAVSEAAWDALGFEIVEYVRLKKIGS
jgi:GNAT superfamily N-acetyltransferase